MLHKQIDRQAEAHKELVATFKEVQKHLMANAVKLQKELDHTREILDMKSECMTALEKRLDRPLREHFKIMFKKKDDEDDDV